MTKIVIGTTYEGIEIPAYLFAKNLSENNKIQSAKKRPAFFLNAGFHSREVTSVA